MGYFFYNIPCTVFKITIDCNPSYPLPTGGSYEGWTSASPTLDKWKLEITQGKGLAINWAKMTQQLETPADIYDMLIQDSRPNYNAYPAKIRGVRPSASQQYYTSELRLITIGSGGTGTGDIQISEAGHVGFIEAYNILMPVVFEYYIYGIIEGQRTLLGAPRDLAFFSYKKPSVYNTAYHPVNDFYHIFDRDIDMQSESFYRPRWDDVLTSFQGYEHAAETSLSYFSHLNSRITNLASGRGGTNPAWNNYQGFANIIADELLGRGSAWYPGSGSSSIGVGCVFGQRVFGSESNLDLHPQIATRAIKTTVFNSDYVGNPTNYIPPYEGAQGSKGNGTRGDFDYSSDEVGHRVIGTNNVALGGIALYGLTTSELETLNDELWLNDIFEVIKSKFVNTKDFVYSINRYPFPLNVRHSKNHLFSNLIFSGVSSTAVGSVIDNTKHVIDCGTVTLKPLTGTYLDTTEDISLYLPFVGFVNISPSDLHYISLDDGKLTGDSVEEVTLGVEYVIDVFTGSGIVNVKLYNFNGSNPLIIAQYPVTCVYSIPLTSADCTSMYVGLIGAGAALLGTAATLGALAPAASVAIPESVAALNTVEKAAEGVAKGAGVDSFSSTLKTAGLGYFAGKALNSSVSANPSIRGNISGFAFCELRPYIILKSQTIELPISDEFGNGIKNNNGYACYSYLPLSELVGTGFTAVENVEIASGDMMQSEAEQIKALLHKGVIL